MHISREMKGTGVKMSIDKRLCTACAEGTVMKLQSRGVDFPTDIYVQYEVNSITYEVRESIKLKIKAIKIGFLPIGMQQIPVMPDTRVGSKAWVVYNPNNPAEAYLRDNIGTINC